MVIFFNLSYLTRIAWLHQLRNTNHRTNVQWLIFGAVFQIKNTIRLATISDGMDNLQLFYTVRANDIRFVIRSPNNVYPMKCTSWFCGKCIIYTAPKEWGRLFIDCDIVSVWILARNGRPHRKLGDGELGVTINQFPLPSWPCRAKLAVESGHKVGYFEQAKVYLPRVRFQIGLFARAEYF